MKTFEQLKEDFSLILGMRLKESISLVSAKKQYNFSLQELTEKIEQEFPNCDLSLGDYQIDDSTTFQNFNSKLEYLIDFIEIRLLSEMGDIHSR